ncbi:MAG: hypothetical protein WBB68_04905 [Candidatus Moraniibacteriota bacterium]
MTMKKIRITRTPDLPAEVDLREAFVGLTIAIDEHAVKMALTADPAWERLANDRSGAFVLRVDAVASLNAAERYEAAEYWNHMPGVLLHFHWDCCELLKN